MNDLNLLLHDEAQLVDWGESRSIGPWVKLRLPDPELLEVFRGMDTATAKKTGHIFNLTLSQGDIVVSETGGQWGSQARELRLSSFFYRPETWKAIGSDALYQEWTRKQKCVICGNQDWVEQIGEGRCVYAHVRRGSGVAIKPEYSGVPMCAEHHKMQHDKGEQAIYKIAHNVELVAPEHAKEWLDDLVLDNLSEWGWAALKVQLGYQHWNQVPPKELHHWAEIRGIEKHLPPSYACG